MSLLSGISGFFGLDIGTTAVRLVELHGNNPNKALSKYGYVPVDPKITMSDAAADQQKLAEVIRQLVEKSRVSTRNVAVGLPSLRVFTTVADVDDLPHNELAKSIRYQADSLIPTPVAESKLDWATIGDSPVEKGKIEILLSSIPNSFIEKRLDLLEGIGLNVVAFEPDNLALTRALLPADVTTPIVILDIGAKSTDIVVTLNGIPRLTRAIPTGVDAIIKAAQQNLNVDEKQAEQFVFKFGVNKDKLEGQVHQAIIGTVDVLTNEIDKSIKFFEARYTDAKIDRLIVSGGAAVLPELPLYLANRFGLNVEICNAWRNVAFSSDRQNELSALSNQFGVAVGLAEREE